MLRRLWIGAVTAMAVGGAAGLVSEVRAAPITLDFSATVTNVSPAELGTLGLSVSVGDLIAGSYTYDPVTATVDVFANPHQGLFGFDVPANSMTYSGIGFTIATDGTDLDTDFAAVNSNDFSVFVGDDLFGGRIDRLGVTSAATVNGFHTHSEISLADLTASIFGDDSLPTAYNLSDFSTGALSLYRIDALFRRHNAFGAQLNTLSAPANVIPEPATLSLFGTGLLGVGFAAWRRRKAG